MIATLPGPFERELRRLEPCALSDEAAQLARDRWNAVAKPIGSLGLLEDYVVQMAALTGSADIDISRRCVVVFCADNGVVAEGVSQCGQEITTLVAEKIARGNSSVCSMCAPVGIDCLAVDIGMAQVPQVEGLIDCHIADGTHNIAQGPAMTREQAAQAICQGASLVRELKAQGYGLLATGEMGIGNTTTTTAMVSVLLHKDPAELVGRGAGLSDEGLVRKRQAIERALRVNEPDPDDVLDVLSKVGGFDIAGMCGMVLGGAAYRVPVVADGLISTLAAYCAYRLQPGCISAVLASHVSAEPAARLLLDLMGLQAPIDAGLRLGEGTGAACLIPLLDMALSLYGQGLSFSEYGMEPYEVRPS